MAEDRAAEKAEDLGEAEKRRREKGRQQRLANMAATKASELASMAGGGASAGAAAAGGGGEAQKTHWSAKPLEAIIIAL